MAEGSTLASVARVARSRRGRGPSFSTVFLAYGAPLPRPTPSPAHIEGVWTRLILSNDETFGVVKGRRKGEGEPSGQSARVAARHKGSSIPEGCSIKSVFNEDLK